MAMLMPDRPLIPKRLLFALVVARGLLAPFAAAASTPSPPPPLEEIVVTGEKMRDTTNKFVRTYTAPSKTLDQISRWRRPLCIKTVGLAPGLNAFIAARLKEVAAQIRAPQTKDEPCEADLSVIFTAHPQELLDEIRTERPRVFGPHYPRELKKLATMTHPIQTWYATAMRDTHGSLVIDTYDTSPFASRDISQFGPPVVEASIASSLQTGLTSEFASVIVIADLNKVEGREIGAIADYIAMTAFARAKTPYECQEVPSIVNLFENCSDGVRATALSAYDMAYLKALYASPSDVRLHSQASDMGALMQETLEKQLAERKAATGGPAR
jgi:hypothetical protein